MGTATPKPPVIGNACGNCDGVLWPAGQTPRFVEIEVKDLEKCPLSPVDAPNGLWWLEQKPLNPCQWLYLDSTYTMVLTLFPQTTVLGIHSYNVPPEWQLFTHAIGGCKYDLVNQWHACGGFQGAINGTVHIFWPGP